MAYKGTAAKSATGASMSKYDVEVEARLQALESKSNSSSKSDGSDSKRVAALEAKVEALIQILNKASAVTEHCPKNAEGVRQINL